MNYWCLLGWQWCCFWLEIYVSCLFLSLAGEVFWLKNLINTNVFRVRFLTKCCHIGLCLGVWVRKLRPTTHQKTRVKSGSTKNSKHISTNQGPIWQHYGNNRTWNTSLYLIKSNITRNISSFQVKLIQQHSQFQSEPITLGRMSSLSNLETYFS